jgi:hypothetical protein
MEYSTEQCEQFQKERRSLAKPKVELVFDLSDLAAYLKNQRARVFLQQGVLRRLSIIERCVLKIYQIFPPDRTKFLSEDELDDIVINLRAFVVDVYGILDNLAWVCVLEGAMPDLEKNRLKIGLYKEATKQYLPQKLRDYVYSDSTRRWFDEYAKVYRDSAAHRIPPYIPPKQMTPEEAKRFNELEKNSWEALMIRRDVDEHELIKKEQRTLGAVSALVGLSLSGEDYAHPFWLHPQILCDSMTIHEILRTFSASMREHYGWPIFDLPDMSVTYNDSV